MRYLCLAVSLFAASPIAAQGRPPIPDTPAPIEDNSFLVEEAYNQERGVVQHVSTFARATRGAGWAYTFTQEWPVAGLRYQLSYTLPVSRLEPVSIAG